MSYERFGKIVAFDFDGVIHSYKSGWKGATVIPDPPVDSIASVIRKIREDCAVVVVSSRCSYYGGIEAIEEWLQKWGIEVDDITATKPPAFVTIDDRAICFDGNANTLLQKINDFTPWNKEK